VSLVLGAEGHCGAGNIPIVETGIVANYYVLFICCALRGRYELSQIGKSWFGTNR
jgi:hydrogenase/urease accessory protein HupE